MGCKPLFGKMLSGIGQIGLFVTPISSTVEQRVITALERFITWETDWTHNIDNTFLLIEILNIYIIMTYAVFNLVLDDSAACRFDCN
jgi:hypothetical protein